MKTTSETRNQTLKIHSISELNREGEGTDSHRGLEEYSSLELNYREYREHTGAELGGMKNPYYPRIKRMKNGKYIMTYQANRISWEVFYALSDDGINWSNARKLLGVCDYPDGYADTMVFMTADLCVLDDGTIIVVSAFRGKANYSKDVNSNGLMIVKSKDNGATWSDKEKIYTGTCWEPYIMQTSSGEVQVYFTQTGHLLAKYGWKNDRRSSCVGLLRSRDRGQSWTKQEGYSAQIVMQQFVFNRDGYDYMCDQMPVATELHNGTIALAAETCNAQNSYRLSVAYSKDNWAKNLAYDEAGPEDRVTNFVQAAGPYIAQFESGETVLSCHRYEMNMYIGTADATSFTNHYQPFGRHKGNWSCVFVDSAHSVIGAMANEDGKTVNGVEVPSFLDVGRMYLNHAIYAKHSQISVDARTDDWEDNTAALFIGSESQAQMSMRFAYDDEKLYLLIERLDHCMTDADAEEIYLPAQNGAYYIVRFGINGIDSVLYCKGEAVAEAELESVECATEVVRTADGDIGKILEAAIPRSQISIGEDGMLAFNAVLYNKDGNGQLLTDTFSNVEVTDVNTWQRVFLTK